MLEIKKFGQTDYGVWVIGTLKYQGLEVTDLFNTNLSDVSSLETKTDIKVKTIKISRKKDKSFRITLEF